MQFRYGSGTCSRCSTVFPVLVTVCAFCSSLCSSSCLCVCRFDLLVNGGTSLTLSFTRAPFPIMHRSVWLPWRVFYVMNRLVMRQEEKDMPTCELSGLVRPAPQIISSPLSTFYSSSPEAMPIIPETQVTFSIPEHAKKNRML